MTWIHSSVLITRQTYYYVTTRTVRWTAGNAVITASTLCHNLRSTHFSATCCSSYKALTEHT
jgi:hypothetical protein